MKKSCNPNEVNPSALTLFDFDTYLLGNFSNVIQHPVNLSWRDYTGELPFETDYIPTPTSDQIPDPCNLSNPNVQRCKYGPFYDYYVIDSSGLIAEGTDVDQVLQNVNATDPIINDVYTFPNHSSEYQEYGTIAYTETVTTSTTNTTTHGCKISPNVSYGRKTKLKIRVNDAEKGFILELGAEYNFSDTTAYTETTNRTVEVPTFMTNVPPNTTAYVTVLLLRGYYTAYNIPMDTNLHGRFSQIITSYDPPRVNGVLDLYPFVELVTTCCGNCSECLPDSIQLNRDNQTVRFVGAGDFISDFASNNLTVTTRFVDNVTGATVAERVEYVPAQFGPAATVVNASK